MALDEPSGRTYQLEPLDTSGVFLGLNAVQVALLGASITIGVAMVSARLPLVVAALPVLGSAALSFGRIAGHPAWEWLPLGGSWLLATVTRGRQWTAPLPLWPDEQGKAAALPPCLAGLEVVDVSRPGERAVGAIHDRRRHTLTAIVPVRGAEFALQPPAEQDRLVGGWGDVLAQFVSGPDAVAQVSWSELVLPSTMDEHLSWLADRGLGPVDDAYAEVVDLATTRACTHETVVSVTVSRERLHHQPAGRRDAEGAFRRALTMAVESLIRGCRSAGLDVADPLGASGLHQLVRTHVDPVARPSTTHLAERLGLVLPAASGPLAMEAAWDHLRVDGAWHRTFWVAGWPRLHVPSSWLEHMLAATGATRTMTVVFVPVSTYQSRRRIQRDLVKLESDATTKEEHGRRVDARHHRATQALLDREQELVAGYVEMAYLGLVTVSAATERELDESTAVVEQVAHEAGMELRRLDGRQDVAWAAALPLGLAPKTLLAT